MYSPTCLATFLSLVALQDGGCRAGRTAVVAAAAAAANGKTKAEDVLIYLRVCFRVKSSFLAEAWLFLMPPFSVEKIASNLTKRVAMVRVKSLPFTS